MYKKKVQVLTHESGPEATHRVTADGVEAQLEHSEDDLWRETQT